MDISTETKSAAVAFLEAHEQLQQDLSDERADNAELRNYANDVYRRNMILEELLTNERQNSQRWLRYAVELAAQLKFIVGGAVRAVQVADEVQRELASACIPPTPGADIKEIERILRERPSTPWAPREADQKPEPETVHPREELERLASGKHSNEYAPKQHNPDAPITTKRLDAAGTLSALSPTSPEDEEKIREHMESMSSATRNLRSTTNKL